ncbi:MAG: transcription-repair coupling factor, partial [candidate division Zixibacteria bacterium]|nr:transcription-repair coupling factor [candidate division Zixibacteria bacterium]
MEFSPLLDWLERSPAVQRMLETMGTGERTLKASGLSGSALSVLIASLYRAHPHPTLVAVDTTETAELLRDDLAGLIGADRALLFPAWEVRPYDHISPDMDVVGQRLYALDALVNRHPVTVVAPMRGLLQHTAPPEWVAGAAIRVSIGQRLPPDELITNCVRLGFDRVKLAQTPGQFSVRGGLIDIFPHTLNRPCRIEFFGDEVESLRVFDAHTQRSVESISSLVILPCREVVDDPVYRPDVAERIAEEGRRLSLKTAELIDHIESGGLFDGVERYLPYYHDQTATLVDYLPDDALVFLCERSQLLIEAERFTADYAEAYETHIPASDLVPSPAEAIANFATLETACRRAVVVELTRSAGSDPTWIDVQAQHTGAYHGAMEVLASRITEWTKQGAAIHVVCDNEGQMERLEEIMGGSARLVYLSVGTLHTGFLIPDIPLVILTDAEIFSRYRRKRRTKAFREGVVIEDFTSLREGDFVVHIDHGIGKYAGLQRLKVDERERDCLTVLYGEGDRLYIPIEQLHRVQKYIGADSEAPTLSRLGGKAWEQAKTRAQKAVRDIAEDLVRLYAARQNNPGHAFSSDTPWQREMEDSFIYDETPDQLRAAEDVKADMERSSPMDRLICGDVGYGKTEVAIRAAFKAVMEGKQVAVLVPTTILAHQHLTTFRERLADYPVTIRMLSRFVDAPEQRKVLEGIRQGAVDIVIGTHRMIQKDVGFKDLGLLVIDEEQRFGVTHKERLKQLKHTVDAITMTATPIPRTLHMALVGARDMTLINTPPKDRLPVHTEVVRFSEETIREAILREVDRGGQVFFVHNRVQSIEAMTEFLHKLVPEATFVVGHGQMEEHELENVMVGFMDRKYDCLVSTMIIESGLDIPNVNTILINRADRFGLAQLYQLRGRVGRSNHRAHAYLMIPASGAVTQDARKRLGVIAEYTALGSGFHIAMRDLEIRGAGNLLGIQQHGF